MFKKMSNSNNFEETPYQFVLKKNGGIVCQRFFKVNNFNPNSLNSIDFSEALMDINGISGHRFGLIPALLKKKSLATCWKNYNPYQEQTKESISTNNLNDRDFFYDFEVKVNNRIVGVSRFNANIFQYEVTDGTDIKPIISSIFDRLCSVMSSRNSDLTFNYTNDVNHSKYNKELSKIY